MKDKESVTPVVVEGVEDTADNTTNDPFVELAKEYGYKEGGPKSAKEFVLFALENLPKKNAALDVQNKSIVDKDRKIAEMEITLNQLAADMLKQKEVAYKQAEAELKAQRKNAIAVGNADLVEELDLAQQNLKNDLENTAVNREDAKTQAYNQLMIDNFREKNASWVYGKSIEELEMKAYAKNLEAAMMAEGMDLKEQLDALQRAVNKKFPEYFDTDLQADNFVEGVQPTTNVMVKPKKTFTFKDLNEPQKFAAKYMEQKGMSIEEYIKNLVETGDLK